jgi:hypothetical protein
VPQKLYARNWLANHCRQISEFAGTIDVISLQTKLEAIDRFQPLTSEGLLELLNCMNTELLAMSEDTGDDMKRILTTVFVPGPCHAPGFVLVAGS